MISECVAWGKRCRKCNCLNHFASQCAYQYTADRTGHTRKHDTCNDTYNLDLYQTNIVTSHTINRVEPYLCKITLNGVSTTMEIDTGASSTLINEEQFTQLKQGDKVLHLQTEGVPSLRTYAGGIIQPIGKLAVSVEYENNPTRLLQLLVVPGRGPNLIGRDWLNKIQLNWSAVHSMECDDFLQPYDELFKEGMGTLQGAKVKLIVDDSVSPRFFKPRPIPFALREKVETELERLQGEGVVRPVTFSDWATPIVPVLKSSGEIRICGDYKLTVNMAAKVGKYPIPNIDDLYNKLSGGKVYSKLDLSHAYLQLRLDDESHKLTTINTTKGLH